MGCQCDILTATHTKCVQNVKSIQNVNHIVFVIQLLLDSNTHTASHSSPLHVMTAATLIISNPRCQGGYYLKVMTIASNCFWGSQTCLLKTSLPAPCVSCSLLIMATVAAAARTLLGVNMLSVWASQTSKLEMGWKQAACHAAKTLTAAEWWMCWVYWPDYVMNCVFLVFERFLKDFHFLNLWICFCSALPTDHLSVK